MAPEMSPDESKLSAWGWTLAIAPAATASAAAESADFHAIYSGEAFGKAGRGIVAAVARGIGPGRRALEAAQIAVDSLAEGYFGAAATLGPSRAASLALASANAWMFSQSRADPHRSMAASLTALIFVGRHVRIIHVGDCRVYRKRGRQLLPLTSEHVRPLPDGTEQLSRCIGGDAQLHIDYIEDDAEPSDRYFVLSKGGYAALPSGRLIEILAADRHVEEVASSVIEVVRAGTGRPADATALVIDVLKLPESSFDEMAAMFAELPIRGVPRDGDNWDGFILGRTLYRSRYTTLKLARDTASGRDVVLKIPLSSMLHDQVFRAGFLREAWVGATVHSPRIASYIDVSPERRSSLYLVLPYYRGETLEARLTRKPPIPYLEGIGLALKLCAVVEELAAFQVVHRDLKPENVLVLPDGEIKLLDLGLAYLPGVDEPDDDRLGGTTRYMAPELFRKRPADQCSEVFSLGVTVYRLFSGGAFPYGARESYPLQRLRPDLPAWLGHCIGRAIEMDRDKRFKDAGKFADALENGLSRGEALPSQAVSWRERISPLRIWQSLALLFGAGFLTLLALILSLSGRRM
jgi:serine/threonine protein phosphatase PrpC